MPVHTHIKEQGIYGKANETDRLIAKKFDSKQVMSEPEAAKKEQIYPAIQSIRTAGIVR